MNIPFISLQANWQVASQDCLPESVAPWILEPASLTARLKRHCSEFKVQVLQEKHVSLPHFLSHLLPNTTDALMREVILWCDNKPCVYAQSWLPTKTLDALLPLATLGDKPLGDFIFQNKSLVRKEIETAVLDVHLAECSAKACYARRSVFELDGVALLVSETFLPAVASLELKSQ